MRYEEDLDVIRNADEAEEVEPGMEEVRVQDRAYKDYVCRTGSKGFCVQDRV
jgi:hypothetical protein